MPILTALWKVAPQPQPLAESSLVKEQLLEDMIVAAPRMLSDEWMLIGRQEDTGLGGRIDLLAIAPDGSLVLIEIKRDRTPREVVAQALDYASWVEKLRAEDIAAIYRRFASGKSLAEDFHQRFGQALDEGHRREVLLKFLLGRLTYKPALGIDQEHRGERADAEFLDCLACAVQQDRERQRAAAPGVLDDRLELLIELGEVLGLGVVKRQDFELVAIGLVVLVEIDQVRQTAAGAGPSPEAPEFHQDPLALEVG